MVMTIFMTIFTYMVINKVNNHACKCHQVIKKGHFAIHTDIWNNSALVILHMKLIVPIVLRSLFQLPTKKFQVYGFAVNILCYKLKLKNMLNNKKKCMHSTKSNFR